MAIGTRKRTIARQIHTPGGSNTRSATRDPGKTGNVLVTSPTFGSSRITSSNNDYPEAAGFTVGNRVRINGTNLNNGGFQITAIDATNHAFLTLDPAPKAETPSSARVIVT